MNEKWTPGPWFVEIGDGEAMDDKGVAYICHQDTCSPDTVICSFPDVIDDEVRANVYLMAAAPDLYAALKELCCSCMGQCHDCEVSSILKKARGEA